MHGTHWKALFTTYFAGQKVVGPVHSARDPLTDVMKRFSIKKEKKINLRGNIFFVTFLYFKFKREIYKYLLLWNL